MSPILLFLRQRRLLQTCRALRVGGMLWLLAMFAGLPAWAQPALEVSLSAAGGTYKLRDEVPINFTVRNTTARASGDDSATNDRNNFLNTARNVTVSNVRLVGTDIYGNAVRYVFPGAFQLPLGNLGPESEATGDPRPRLPNDGTLHDVSGDGYTIEADVFYEFDDGFGNLVPVNGAYGTGAADIFIEVLPDLELRNITYTSGSYRGGDLATFRAVIRNNILAERDGEAQRQGRPLRPVRADAYRLDTRLSVAPAYGENLSNEFRIFFTDLLGDLGNFVPDESTVIRQVRVVGTPQRPGVAGFPPAYGVLRPATATITVDGRGRVTGVTVTAGGAGYAPNATLPVFIQAGQITGGASFAGTVQTTPAGTIPTGTRAVTINRPGAGYVAGRVTLINAAGRNYNPQPSDGFLDLGETLEIIFEARIPDNFNGDFFVCGQIDSLQNIPEPPDQDPAIETTDSAGQVEPVNNNTFVSSEATKILVQSSAYPETELVSGSEPQAGVAGVFGNGPSDSAAVSAAGEWVAFASFATNLASDGQPSNGSRQIYARQPGTGEIALVSCNDAGAPGRANSANPAINADGRYIAFESNAANLIKEDRNGVSDIFVRDLAEGRTIRVSVVSGTGAPADGASFNPGITADGRFVSFESNARNLDPTRRLNNQAGGTLVYVHDRAVDGKLPYDRAGNTATYLVSLNQAGQPANAASTDGRLSGNGDYVVFLSLARNLPGGTGDEQVYRVRLQNGRPVAATVELVSCNDAGTPGNARSLQPSVNGDGHQIAFSSEANNLVPGDTNGVADVFVRNLAERRNGQLVEVKKTVRVSVSNPRLASGTITFAARTATRGLAPANNPAANETLVINDGQRAVRFVFGGRQPETPTRRNVPIGVNAGVTRDNLVRAINLVDNFRVTAAVSTAPPDGAAQFKAPYFPSVFLQSTVPGVAGNRAITTTSRVILVTGMSGGGTQAEDPQRLPDGVPAGSITPSIDSSGRYVAFRSVARNLVVFEPTAQNRFLPKGALIRPQLGQFADIYVHDRKVKGGGSRVFDQGGNVATELVSLNTFGGNTGAILGRQTSGNNALPSLSGDGRFIAFASDSENTYGLLFGDSNLVPYDTNSVRDVFLRNRNTPGSRPPLPPTNLPEIVISSPANELSFVTGSTVLLAAEAKPAAGKTIKEVQFVYNTTVLATLTQAPYFTTLPLLNPGTYNISAIVTDSLGVTTSTLIRIFAAAPVGDAPSIAVTHPTPGGAGDTANDFSDASSFFLNAVVEPGRGSVVDFVKSIDLRKGGSQYTSAPTVRITGGGGTGAQAVAEVANGRVTAVKITNPGAGYFGTPVVTFAGGGGAGASAVAVVNRPLFFANGKPIRAGTVTQVGKQYGVFWRPETTGVTAINAQVTDSRGNTVVSAPLSFTIDPVVRPLPTISMLSAAQAVAPKVGAEVLLEARFRANSPTPVSRVDFYADQVYVGAWEPSGAAQQAEGVASVVWIPERAGTYRLAARVMQVLAEPGDNSVVSSNPMELTIQEATPAKGLPPVVLLTDPVSEPRLARGSSVYLNVTAVDQDGVISDNGVKIFIDGQEQKGVKRYGDVWSVRWTPTEIGRYLVTASAIDNVGNATALPRTQFEVVQALRPLPEVRFDQVVGGSQLSQTDPVVLRARAKFFNDASTARVDFYANGVLIGTGTTDDRVGGDGFRTYQLTWQPTTGGSVVFSAKANAINFTTGVGDNNVVTTFGAVVSGDSAPSEVNVITGKTADERFVRDLYPILLNRAARFPEWQFYVRQLARGMDQADVVMAIMDYNRETEVFGYKAEYGRTLAMVFAAYLRLGLRPSTDDVQSFLSVLASDQTALPNATPPYTVPPGTPYGATLGLAQAMQDIFLSQQFRRKYPTAMSFSYGQFVDWLRTQIFPKHSLGPVQGVAGFNGNIGLMGQPEVELYPQGAAMAFLSRLVVATYIELPAPYRQPESLLQRQFSTTALKFLLSGGEWDVKLGVDDPYRKAVVQRLLKQYPVGLPAAAQASRRLQQTSGTYVGIVNRAPLNGQGGGSLRLEVDRGRVLGSLSMNGSTFAITGSMEPDGKVVAVATLATGGGYRLDLLVRPSGSSAPRITGSIAAGQQNATLVATQVPWGAGNPATAYQGVYRISLPVVPSSVKGVVPSGDRFADVTVLRNGTVRVVGRLANGVPFSWTGSLATDGSVAIQADLGPQGSVLGSLRLVPQASGISVRGNLDWRRAGTDARAGFSVLLRSHSS